MEIALDPQDLTLGELEEFEAATGMTMADIGKGTAKAILGLIWLAKRREDPSFTLDDARKLKVGEITFANPTAAAPSLRKSRP